MKVGTKKQKIPFHQKLKEKLYRILPKKIRQRLLVGKIRDGEELASEERSVSKIAIIAGSIHFILFFFGVNYLSHVFLASMGRNYLKMTQADWNELFHHWSYLFTFTKSTMYVLLLDILLSLFIYKRFSLRFANLSHGQKGDSRLTTLKELEAQYLKIPERTLRFKGYGGVPVSHYLNYYFIDTDTVNTLIIGTSRSGKGETIVFPLIDNLSRAENQSSMIIHDPKGELYSSSKDTLEKLGYNVQVLNVLNPLEGMSYNPLALILEAWKNRDYVLAQDLTNSFSHMIFQNEGGENAWVYDGAKGVLNGCILALIQECEKTNDLDKVTLYNINQMLTELGTKYLPVENPNEQPKRYLDAYFDALPQGNIAKSQYAAAALNGEKSKGNILSAVLDAFKLFSFENVGKMTSNNSISLRSVGFPKYLNLRFDKTKYANRKCEVKFISKERHLLMTEVVKVNIEGIASLNFNCSLNDGDFLLLTDLENQEDYVYIQLSRQKNTPLLTTHILVDRKNILTTSITDVEIYYSEAPTAIFMISPDYDTSKNLIMSIFVDQLYITLMRNASVTRGKKCHRRVHFILDEFGNMSPLAELDKKLTVCLSRNVLFDLFIQSYNQLYAVYNDNVAKVAKENCQNHIYIASTDKDTQLEFAERIGKHTVESASRDKNLTDIKTSNHVSVNEEYLITPERINGIQEGETLVLRSLHRQDLKRKKVRPYPIFNTKDTSMPYRYQFLADQYDTSKDIIDLDLSSRHATFDLEANKVDFVSIQKRLALQKEEEIAQKEAQKTKADAKETSKNLSTKVEKHDSVLNREEFKQWLQQQISDLNPTLLERALDFIYKKELSNQEEAKTNLVQLVQNQMNLSLEEVRKFIDQYDKVHDK